MWELEAKLSIPRFGWGELFVSLGPFWPSSVRRAQLEQLDECTLCGEELVESTCGHGGQWIECPDAESHPGEGHTSVLVGSDA